MSAVLLVLAALCCSVLLPPVVIALDNGLGRTPGLGWNSDYCLNCVGEQGVALDYRRLGGYQNEAYIRTYIADVLVSSGLRDIGYRYVNMDAGWDLLNRSASGDLVPDPSQWPSGINVTSAYLHSLGLGFGLYGDRGNLDCSGRPGQLGHEVQDAALLAAMGVDWFKSDSCSASGDHDTAFAEYGAMRDALNRTGRPVWFALCGWNPWYAPVGQSLGNSWRIGPDTGSGWTAVMTNVQNMLGIGEYAGRTAGGGGWNDMSLLLLPGMGSGENLITQERHRSQFALHCVLAANMLMTGNLSALDSYVLQTWGNAEAVAVNQDPAALPFTLLQQDNSTAAALCSLGYIPASVAECGGEPAYQSWTYGAPAPQFFYNNASNQCLNVEGCGTTIIYDSCTIKGPTCAGPDKLSNEQWALQPDGSLVSLLPGALCVTVRADSTLELAQCASPLPANQTWAYNAETKQLSTGAGLCLTAPQPSPPANDTLTLLVGRPLHDGSWALLALNNQPFNTTIRCGAACFAALGFPTTAVLTVRDLWLHADVNSTTATVLDIPVGANGSSTLWKLSPQGCATDMDCNLNGLCNATSGQCVCDAAWGGRTCEQLQLLPAMPGQGTCDPSLNGTATGYTTTWGGNPLQDPATGTWHLFPAEMAQHCGMTAWGSQSQVAHYTSPTLLGPYTRVGTAVGPFAHNPVVIPIPPASLPPGSNYSYLMMHIGLGCNSEGPHTCNYTALPYCTNGTTPTGTVPRGLVTPTPPGLHFSETHLAWSLDGPWVGLDAGWTVPRCSNNPSPLFLANGSLMIACHSPMQAGMECPDSGGLSTAVSTTANWTHGEYVFRCLALLNPNVTVGDTLYTTANEDPHLYQDGRGNLHILTHNQGPGYQDLPWFGGDVRGDGGHFFSGDGGESWRFTWHAAYSGVVSYASAPTDGPSNITQQKQYKRERPKLVQEAGSGRILALSNGVGVELVDAFQAGDDSACTLVVAVAGAGDM